MAPFASIVAQLAREGHRRLVVLSGDVSWTQARSQALREQLPGDWLWVGDDAPVEPGCAPQALSRLLGREFTHAIFDARCGFDVSAFAALSGTLRAGSLLVLLLPALTRWPEQVDQDSVRWSDSPDPVPTPRFVRHFCRVITQDPAVIVWQQHDPLPVAPLPFAPEWLPASGEPLNEQAKILTALESMASGVAVVTAPRGRGKSALAGMLLQRIKGRALVTAPAKGATEVIAQFAGDKYHFMAPDALLACTEDADWLMKRPPFPALCSGSWSLAFHASC